MILITNILQTLLKGSCFGTVLEYHWKLNEVFYKTGEKLFHSERKRMFNYKGRLSKRNNWSMISCRDVL